MKKIVLKVLPFILLISLTSCSKKINNKYFSDDTLIKYELTADFPKLINKTSSLIDDNSLYINLTIDEYTSYSSDVYSYLNSEDYYYVGSYVQKGLIAEMLPNYVYTPLDETYAFSSMQHHFIYSTSEVNKDENNYSQSITPCYEISIERVEDTKFNWYSKKTYNTIVKINKKLGVSLENI